MYKKWLQIAYKQNGEINPKLWETYIPLEQKIYEEILGNKTNVIESTVKDFSDKHFNNPVLVCGFIDGINGALKNPLNLEELEVTEDFSFKLEIDFKELYKRMVEYKAFHLMELPQWESIFTAEEREELYIEQRNSTTFIRTDSKIGRNDPCPCDSGKKYKKCCGA